MGVEEMNICDHCKQPLPETWNLIQIGKVTYDTRIDWMEIDHEIDLCDSCLTVALLCLDKQVKT